MNIFRTLIIAAGIAFAGSVASAATFTSNGDCGDAVTNPSYDDCWGLAVENANAQQVDVNADFFDGEEGLFGYTDWSLIDSDGSFGGGDDFTISDNDYTMVAVLLKSANTFGAYLYEGGLSGVYEFETANENDLSNYVVVGRVPEVVPLPAAGFLLLGGLGALGFMRRRKG